MKRIFLNKVGAVLTGRPFGAQSYLQLKKEVGDQKVELDFSGVYTMGSSFGEEVVVPFAKDQDNEIIIHAEIEPVRDCLELIAKDFKLTVHYLKE